MITDAPRDRVSSYWLRGVLFTLCTGVASSFAQELREVGPPVEALQGQADVPGEQVAEPISKPSSAEPLITLGVGDAVSVQIYGKPDLNTKTYVSDDGTITIPLAGHVPVVGMSPAQAGQRIASAFRDGNILVDPQVTVFMLQFRSHQVSVLGAVKAPGRFVVESTTTVMDVLAQAGGTTENSGNVVVLLRTDDKGGVARYSVDLRGLSDAGQPLPTLTLRGGDSIFVPQADQFYISGEVHTPNMYRIEPGMTVAQAIARGGGITLRGSDHRIDITHRQSDGTDRTSRAALGDAVEANDIIRVKERIF